MRIQGLKGPEDLTMRFKAREFWNKFRDNDKKIFPNRNWYIYYYKLQYIFSATLKFS